MPLIEIIVVYDIATTSAGGEARLRSVAQACLRIGQRVQASVMECMLEREHLPVFLLELAELIDPRVDSVRVYALSIDTKRWVLGVRPVYDIHDPLIF